MTKMIFVNLPVTDLKASIAFYKAIGCEQNMQFSDDNAASMMWSDTIVFMILTREYYQTFTPKPLGDPKTNTLTLISLSFDSREAVDAIVEAAAANGGKADPSEIQDLGFMYGRSFEDPDGHGFGPVYMDMSALPIGEPH
jgi:uncharacterized protein